MENPGKILVRAQLSRRFRTTFKASPEQVAAERMPAAEPVHRSSHAGYSALMRSHDRMRTRHISGQGGKNGA
ncbi:MAG: hypothetical protein J6M10_04055 [Clostridia bacterium]|nr:hypothetical protein [Clostridia bacterium]